MFIIQATGLFKRVKVSFFIVWGNNVVKGFGCYGHVWIISQIVSKCLLYISAQWNMKLHFNVSLQREGQILKNVWVFKLKCLKMLPKHFSLTDHMVASFKYLIVAWGYNNVKCYCVLAGVFLDVDKTMHTSGLLK
jgi:hypothetical protein